MKQEIVVQTIRRLTKLRAELLHEYPFWGSLLMHLRFGVAECGTAFTDMQRVVFDPDFAARLTDEELKFVLNHEVMHCVLEHCSRGKNCEPDLFNEACDIVVNSNILAVMGIDEYMVDGRPVMHRTPDGQEGYLFSAETVYAMLLTQWTRGHFKYTNVMDRHDVWKDAEITGALADKWREQVKKCTGGRLASKGVFPPSVRKILQEAEEKTKLNWKRVLRDFIKNCEGPSDYDFRPPDRRFASTRFIYPGFHPMEEERIEDIWFCVDTSASVNRQQLGKVMKELEGVLSQIDGFRGKLSFFDTRVTDPVLITNYRQLKDCQIVGGGGTSFHIIFKYMKEHMKRNRPAAIIILTDGYADYPDKAAAGGIPVLWIMVDSTVTPPWGRCIYI